MSDLSIQQFTPADQPAAKALILQGLEEHWGALDLSLNPDLNDIAASYAAGVFLCAWLDGELAGFDYDNPVTDPFDGTVVNNTLIVNGAVIPPGTKITP